MKNIKEGSFFWSLNTCHSTIEFAVLIIIIIAAFIAMQVYLKRGIQGRLRGNTDSIGEQYDPQKTSSDFTVSRASNITTVLTTQPAKVEVEVNGVIASDLISMTQTDAHTAYDNTTRSGWEKVDAPGT